MIVWGHGTQRYNPNRPQCNKRSHVLFFEMAYMMARLSS